MISICITGQPLATLKSLEGLLADCGMHAPRPLQRDAAFDIWKWHERVTLSQSQVQANALANYQPGRIWEQLAVDLVLANMESQCWGWAHEEAVDLLDFWAQLEPATRFVLVCEDSIALICRLIDNGLALENIIQALDVWKQRQYALLRFYLRNPDISTLVWSSVVHTQPEQIVQDICQAWNAKLNVPDQKSTAWVRPNVILQQIAQQIQLAHPDVVALDNELQAVMGPTGFKKDKESFAITDVINNYLTLLDRTVEAEQIAELQWQLKITQDAAIEEKNQALSDLDILAKAKDEETVAKNQALVERDAEAVAKADLQAKNIDLQEESELLLQQLHQVQEELEKYYLKHQEVEAQFTIEASAKQDAQTQLAIEQSAHADTKNQVDALAKAHEAETQAKNQALAERDALAQARVAEAAAKEQALAERDALALAKEEEASAKADAQAKNKDFQEESDLLLEQLHQVQEELEKYYLKYQEVQQDVKKLQDRWIRAVIQHPTLHDFEWIEIISESVSDKTTLWRVNQLNVQGKTLGPFEFKTLMDKGIAGFSFSRDASGKSPVTRWPLVSAKDQALSIIPAKGGEDSHKRSTTILQLGTTDWHMVRTLSDELVKALRDGAVKPESIDSETLLAGLKEQRRILDKVPALLRFDHIKLIGQQYTAKKWVLGLHLSHVDFKDQQLDQFEFQVQLNTAANATVTSAHLIFDAKTTGSPFDSWTGNLNNLRGEPVMAVMLSNAGWDPKIWHHISKQDQQWLKNIVISLPILWASLQQQGYQLEKGLATWIQAASDMRTWSQQAVLPAETLQATQALPGNARPSSGARKTITTAKATVEATTKNKSKTPVKTTDKSKLKVKALAKTAVKNKTSDESGTKTRSKTVVAVKKAPAKAVPRSAKKTTELAKPARRLAS